MSEASCLADTRADELERLPRRDQSTRHSLADRTAKTAQGWGNRKKENLPAKSCSVSFKPVYLINSLVADTTIVTAYDPQASHKARKNSRAAFSSPPPRR